MNSKKIGMLICLLIMGAAGLVFCNKDTSRAADMVGIVSATSGLNVRQGAGTSYTVTATLPNGTSVTITETVTDQQKASWYKITATVDGTAVSGYVSAAYVVLSADATVTPTAAATATPSTTTTDKTVTTYRYETTYSDILVPAKTLNKTKVYSKAGGTRKVISKKKVTLPKNKQIKLLGEKEVNGKKWFRIRFKWKGKTRYGYVRNIYVKMSSATGKIVNVKANANVRKKAGNPITYLMDGKKKIKIAKNTVITIKKDVKSGKSRWYKISFTYGGKTRTGYLNSKYVKLTKKPTTKKVAVVALSDSEFEKSLTEQGFPESYKASLRSLHKTYPYWQFQAYKTGVKWEDAVTNESKLGVNLISNSKSAAWKSTEAGAYDSSTGTWKVFDGSTWVAASRTAIAYYMDPRNFLNDRSIFQFESLEYQSQYQTKSGVETILSNTPFAGQTFEYSDLTSGNSKTISYADAFIAAAAYSGVSPYHLASRVKQEVVTSSTTTSIAVTGTNSTYPGIYNFYNIGATSSSTPALNGLKWASKGTTYLRPWTDRYRSILGGASYIGTSYIAKGQNTGYLQKFNVTSNSRYDHQYMTNVEAAYSEAIKTKKAYDGMLDTAPIVFSIPVYDDMPETICAAPQ
jgi:uncharacterized protein YraI